MPMIIRPSEMSCSVAYALASTVGSRVAGFVTMCPSFIRVVSLARSAIKGIDSSQRTCESYVQPYSKPCCSAKVVSSIRRVYGGSGRMVTPKLSMGPPEVFGQESAILARIRGRRGHDAAGAGRYQCVHIALGGSIVTATDDPR